MELVERRTLKQIIKSPHVQSKFNLNAEDKDNVVRQICTAIAFLHGHPKKLIHRDIKPENIMLTFDKVIKVCDLGLAKMNTQHSQLVTTQGKRNCAGTPLYMAPEVYIYKTEATTKSDVWSLACTIVEFYNFRCIWNFIPPHDTLEKCLRNERVPEIGEVPSFMKDILIKCFNYCACDRPTAKDLLDILQDHQTDGSK